MKSVDNSYNNNNNIHLQLGKDIIFKWLMILVVCFAIPTMISFSYVVDMVFSGGEWYFVAFAVIFITCVNVNGKLICKIAYEIDVLRRCNNLHLGSDLSQYKDTMLFYHIENLKTIWLRSKKKYCDQDSLIEILHTKLKNESFMVSVASNIMITIGLLGTVSGLISSIAGLQIAGNEEALMNGVSKAIDGMGVAFYTTLVGSMLGGVTLKILHYYVDSKIDMFVLSMAEIVEIKIISHMRAEGDSNFEGIVKNIFQTIRSIKEDSHEVPSFSKSI